ncbi:hypothetical protein B0H13DRAFT_1866111 [Mycena leptocephala]|nr:hypothetical protein B0H13DRAFT_1866111 [Mycena leptocephala]
MTLPQYSLVTPWKTCLTGRRFRTLVEVENRVVVRFSPGESEKKPFEDNPTCNTIALDSLNYFNIISMGSLAWKLTLGSYFIPSLMPKVPSRARKACLRCHDKKIRCDLAPSCDQREECGRKKIKCTYWDSNTRKRSSPKKELQIVQILRRWVFQNMWDALSKIEISVQTDSLKQLVFDLGRRVQSIENAVSRLRTSHHLSYHSAGLGWGQKKTSGTRRKMTKRVFCAFA